MHYVTVSLMPWARLAESDLPYEYASFQEYALVDEYHLAKVMRLYLCYYEM